MYFQWQDEIIYTCFAKVLSRMARRMRGPRNKIGICHKLPRRLKWPGSLALLSVVSLEPEENASSISLPKTVNTRQEKATVNPVSNFSAS